jgi:hypothetical protein
MRTYIAALARLALLEHRDIIVDLAVNAGLVVGLVVVDGLGLQSLLVRTRASIPRRRILAWSS